MESEHGYLMNIASILYIGCYVPELYANYKNKNSNIYNLPEKIIIFIGTSFAFSYSLINMDTALLINYGPILILDLIALLMRAHYAYKNAYVEQCDGTPPKFILNRSDSRMPIISFPSYAGEAPPAST